MTQTSDADELFASWTDHWSASRPRGWELRGAYYASDFWVTSGITGGNLDAVLTSIAEDEGRCVFTNSSVDWLFCPYDGGMDVFAPTPHDRDVLKARHTDWLSPRPDGL